MTGGRDMLFVIPAPGFGHIGSNVMLANMLLRRDNRFSVTILLIDSPFSDERDAAKKLAGSNPDLDFVHVPLADELPAGKCYMSHIEAHKLNVAEVVRNLVAKTDRVCFVLDMFCSSMVDVATELDAPCYMYCTTGAAFLGFCNFVTTRSEAGGPGPDWLVPSYASPVPTSVLPNFALSEVEFASYSKTFKRFGEMKGMIVNTISELEPYALRSFVEARGFPHVYPVGPLVDISGVNRVSETDEAERVRILSWLDEQESESVVFLCFGREGCFKAEQVKEIAAGLELSGVKFLWALRKQVPPGGEDAEDVSEILPEGFLARMGGGGQGVICGWAPQAEILAHPAVGGFVTHCGWKSILESLWFGVPTAAWPLYAEQQMNAFYMVKELKLAVELKIDYRINQEDLVTAAEIQRAIRCLMGVQGSKQELLKTVKAMSEIIRTVHAEGGSSFNTQDQLIFHMLGQDQRQRLKTMNLVEELETRSSIM